jgi:hypothetical protein
MFILQTFPSQEDEIQTIHLPIVFAALVDFMNVRGLVAYNLLSSNTAKSQITLHKDVCRASRLPILQGLLLTEEILQHIHRNGLLQRPELTNELQAASHSQPSYVFACTFYGIPPIPDTPTRPGFFDVPLALAFEDMVNVNLSCARLLETSDKPSFSRDVVSQSLLLLDRLVERIGSSLAASWNPSEWLAAILRCMEHEVCLSLES